MTSQRVDQPERNDPSEARSEAGQPPPPEDDLREILTRRPSHRRSLPSFPATLIGLLVILSVFLGGMLIGKHAGASSTTASSQNGLPGGGTGNFPGGGPGGGGGFNPGSGFATGTVTRVVGDTVYVQMADGTTVKVVTNGSTQIRVTRTGSVLDLATGSTVVVQGTASDDGGTITANTVTEGSLGGFPGGLNGPGAPSPSPSSG